MADTTHETVLSTQTGMNRLARVYAEALANAAKDNLDGVGEELDSLVRFVQSNKPTAAYFGNPAISRKSKAPVLAKVFSEGRSSGLLGNLVGVLNRNGRLGLLPAIRAEYQGLRDTQAGRVRVIVRAAVALTETQRTTLIQSLTTSLKATPILDVRVEPELLGGLVIQIGDRVIDTSVRTRLQTIRTQLMDRGSSYVLQNQG